jgi:DNA excision repair protein ERCC-4
MDFRIVIDSREKEPYTFACEVLKAKLDAGDYSVHGFEHQVAVERKSLADFVGTVIHNYDRFSRELEKLSAMNAACVVVEADLNAVLCNKHTDSLRAVSPHSLLGAATYIGIKYKVPVFWCGSRPAAVRFTDTFLRSYIREISSGGGLGND